MWGGRDAFCSIALPHLLCLLESPNTQRILHVSGTYYLHLHLLKSCIVAQRGQHKEVVGDKRTVLWKEETLISISAINTLERKEKVNPKPQTPHYICTCSLRLAAQKFINSDVPCSGVNCYKNSFQWFPRVCFAGDSPSAPSGTCMELLEQVLTFLQPLCPSSQLMTCFVLHRTHTIDKFIVLFKY